MSEFRELSVIEIDAVSGGMMNNGQGDSLQTQPKNGGPPDNDHQNTNKLVGGLLTFGAIVIFSLGL